MRTTYKHRARQHTHTHHTIFGPTFCNKKNHPPITYGQCYAPYFLGLGTTYNCKHTTPPPTVPLRPIHRTRPERNPAHQRASHDLKPPGGSGARNPPYPGVRDTRGMHTQHIGGAIFYKNYLSISTRHTLFMYHNHNNPHRAATALTCGVSATSSTSPFLL